MKFIIALSLLLSFSVAHSQTVESYYTPTNLIDSEAPRPPQAQVGLYMQNNCYTDVMAAIRFQNTRGQTESRGFYRLFPGQVVYLTNMRSRDYLLYAATVDNRVFWRGPYPLPLNGVHYSAMLVRLPSTGNAWTTILYCR